MTKLYQKKFIFIAGIPGSGTTLNLKLLMNPNFAVGLGGVPFSKGYENISKKINTLTASLWDIPDSKESQKETVNLIREIQIPNQFSYVIYKRSYPFIHKDCFPRLSDIIKFSNNYKLIVTQRDLRFCAASYLSKKIAGVDSIEKAARRIQEAKDRLDLQLSKVNNNLCKVVSYDRLIKTPNNMLREIEQFIGYKTNSILSNIIRLPSKKSFNIFKENETYLNDFFNYKGE